MLQAPDVRLGFRPVREAAASPAAFLSPAAQDKKRPLGGQRLVSARERGSAFCVHNLPTRTS